MLAREIKKMKFKKQVRSNELTHNILVAYDQQEAVTAMSQVLLKVNNWRFCTIEGLKPVFY